MKRRTMMGVPVLLSTIFLAVQPGRAQHKSEQNFSETSKTSEQLVEASSAS